MPKITTREIQSLIYELGKELGFRSVKEERLHGRETYAPVYDVVWYLDMAKYFKLDGLEKLFEKDTGLFERLKTLPFAGFEISP
ncbi:hypothetical protein FACS1894211_05060 [Clostridia bacterium]|nr:hypothetical protein FACS1894211_05060 [Clostridia bacterium]